MITSPRDDREQVVGMKQQVETVFRVSGGMVAMSTNGWWVDENDNVYAPDERPTLVLDNGQSPPNSPLAQILWHEGNSPVLEMNAKVDKITMQYNNETWTGVLTNGDK